jgi:hypothetical protein
VFQREEIVMVRMLFIGGLLLLASSCVHGREGFINTDGAKRAAFELSCNEDALTITEINSNTIGVEGCGKKVVYKLVQTGNGLDWIRD